MQLYLQIEQDTRVVRKAAAERQEANEREFRANHLSELQEMHKQVEAQERELKEQRILLREQKKAVAVETPRMRQKHEEELLQVDIALEKREEELEEARHRLEDQAQVQLAEVERLQDRAMTRVRNEAKKEALLHARTAHEQSLELHAQEMDEVRAALLEKGDNLKQKYAMLKLQQARALNLPFAQRWASQQRIRTTRKQVDKETLEIDIAKKALEAEAERELNNIMTAAQDSLREQRREMTEAHLHDLDRASDRFRDQKRDLEEERENLSKRIQEIEQETPRMREIREKEMDETRKELERRGTELAEQQKAVQEEAARRVEEIQEREKVEAEALKRRLEKRIAEELERQHIELEETAAAQRHDMEHQTQHLLDMQKAHVEAAARDRAEVDAKTVQALKVGADELRQTRRHVLEEFRQKQEELTEEQDVKVARLDEGMGDMKQDLLAKLLIAESEGENQKEVNRLAGELKEVEEDYIEQLQEIHNEKSSEEAQARVELGQSMDELTEEAEKQLTSVDDLKREIEENMMKEQEKAKDEMQRALEEAREKHMSYVQSMETTFAEREKTLASAQQRHTREQQRLLRKRSASLHDSIQEALETEEDLRVELEAKQGVDSSELESLLTSATRDRQALENTLKLAEEKSLEVLNDMGTTFKKQKEALNIKRTELEASFRKKESEFEVITTKLEDDIIQKTETVKEQLTRSLSQQSNQLSRENLKLEDATERLAQDMKMATERVQLQESQAFAQVEMANVGSQLRSGGTKLPEDERTALEERKMELEATQKELETQEQTLNEQQEANFAPQSPRISSKENQPPVFQNPFVPQSMSLQMGAMNADTADFEMMDAIQPIHGLNERLQYQQPVLSQMSKLQTMQFEQMDTNTLAPKQEGFAERLQAQKPMSSQMGTMAVRGWDDTKMNALQPSQGLNERLQYTKPLATRERAGNLMRQAMLANQFSQRVQPHDPFTNMMNFQGDESTPPNIVDDDDDPFALAMHSGGDQSAPPGSPNSFHQSATLKMQPLQVSSGSRRMNVMQPMESVSERLQPSNNQQNQQNGVEVTETTNATRGPPTDYQQYHRSQQQQLQQQQPHFRQPMYQQTYQEQRPEFQPHQTQVTIRHMQEEDPFLVVMDSQGDQTVLQDPSIQPQQYMSPPRLSSQSYPSVQRHTSPGLPQIDTQQYLPKMQYSSHMPQQRQQRIPPPVSPHHLVTSPHREATNQQNFPPLRQQSQYPQYQQQEYQPQQPQQPQQQQYQPQQQQEYQPQPHHQQQQPHQYQPQQQQYQPPQQQYQPPQQQYQAQRQQQPHQYQPQQQQYQPPQQQYQPKQQYQPQQRYQPQEHYQPHQRSTDSDNISGLRAQLEVASREKAALANIMENEKQEGHQAGHQAGHRKAQLQNTLLGALRSQAQQNKHAQQMEVLNNRIREAESIEQALHVKLQQAESNGKNRAQQSLSEGERKGQRKAHLQHSLLGHLRTQARDNIVKDQMSSLNAKVQDASQHQQALQEELERVRAEQEHKENNAAKGLRHLDLKHKMINAAKSNASAARAAAKHAELQTIIEEGEKQKEQLLKNLETERAKGEAAARSAQEKGMRRSDVKNRMLLALRSQAATKKHEENIIAMQDRIDAAERQQITMREEAEIALQSARQEGEEKGAAALRSAHLKHKLMGHLKKQVLTKKFATEKEALEAEREAVQLEKKQVDEVLAKTRKDAATAATEAEFARKKERQARLKLSLKTHLMTEAQKEKDKLKAQALKEAALAATQRANFANQQLADARELADLQAKETVKKLKLQRVKGSLFSHLKKEAAANKRKASRMSDVRKLFKKHGTGVLDKVRTVRERKKDKDDLAAMKQALVLKEQQAEEEKQRIEQEQQAKIEELQKQHEEVKKKMAEDAKAEAERVAKEATAARSSEVRGLWGKHRGNLLDKARAAREARFQKENLTKLMADIAFEKQESTRKAKEAEDKLSEELESQKQALETSMEEERLQHAAEIEQEAIKLREEKKDAIQALQASLEEKHREEQQAAVVGAVKAATKKTFKGLMGKHSLNLKRVADLEKKEARLESARLKLEQQEQEATDAATNAKKTRFSSMLKRRKGDIGRMAKLTKAQQKVQATAQKAMSDLQAMKKEKEGSERKNRFASIFSRAAHKSKAQTLQSETEKLKLKWINRPDLRKMIASHNKLASLFRGFKLRRQWPDIRAKQLIMKEERHKAATVVQKIARGLLGRNKMERLRKLAWFDRPKTDATTNTVGYSHATQQTRAAGALMLGDLGRQASIDSLDSARDIAERHGELSDDSMEDLDMVLPVTATRGREGKRHGQRKEHSKRKSPLSSLYRYTSKPIATEMTAYDPKFPSNRDDLINAAIETLMQ